MYYEYDDLILGKDWCWDRHGTMIPDTYHSGYVTTMNNIITCAYIMAKDLIDQSNFLHALPEIEDYEVDDAIIIHLFWMDHWGHWLLDGMANLWPLFDKSRPSDNIIIIHSHVPFFFPEEYKKYLISRNKFIIPKRIKKAYIPRKTFGIDLDVFFGSKLLELSHNTILPSKLRELSRNTILPSDKLTEVLGYLNEIIHGVNVNPSAFIFNDKKHIETIQWFGDLHRISPTKIHKKVFLDRRRSATANRLIPNIDLLIQKIEESDEWTIFDFGADNISIGDQINILENADVIAGPIGSAFFGLLMTRHFKGKVIYLEKEFSERTRSPYDYQNNMMDLDAEYKNVGTLNDDELEEITNYLMEL